MKKLQLITFIFLLYLCNDTIAQTLYLPSGTGSISTTLSGNTNVGIGTNNPEGNLHVKDASTTSNPSIKLSNGSGALVNGIAGCNGCYANQAIVGDAVFQLQSQIAGVIKPNLVFTTNTVLNRGCSFKFTSYSYQIFTISDSNIVRVGTPTLSPSPAGGFNFGVQGNTALNGKVIIGKPTDFTAATPFPNNYNLYVSNGILTEKVKIALKNTSDWSDFVFAPNYKLMPLDSVAAYVKENKHLPDVPSAQDVVDNGIDVGKMDAVLLQKIEELTLYMIELENKNKKLEERLSAVELNKKGKRNRKNKN